MSNTVKGITSGFVATVVLSAVMLLKIQLHLVPEQYSLIGMLGRLAGGTGNAWADHFIIGTIIWGLAFAAYDSLVSIRAYWLKGLTFSLGAWLVTMLAFLPFVGAGLFGWKLGILATVVPLIQHLIYGLVLGVTYGLLSAWAPVKEAEQSPQT
jgi:hypothetical protein